MGQLSAHPDALLAAFCERHGLPDEYPDAARRWLWPLACDWAGTAAAEERPLCIGINGAQGSGKTTVTELLAEYLDHLGCPAVSLSIDDFYLGHAERAELGKRVHPLLATRGVPGTHDLPLAETVFEALGRLEQGRSMMLPVFDKHLDDRRPPQQWRRIEGPVRIILFEGWCVGTPPQPAADLVQPVNRLEQEEDPDGRWRRWVNAQLGETYPRLFARLDRLVFLAVPSMERVRAWRRQQEAQLRQARDEHADPEQPDRSLSPAAIDRFVQHYERLTRHALRVLPGLAHVVMRLDANHRIVDCRRRPAAPPQPGQVAD